MLTVVRRIEPTSLAKIYAAVTGALALVFALPAGCVLSIVGGTNDELGGLGAGLGLFVIVLYPIVGVVMGFVLGWLYAFVYNLVADRVGGVEVELDDFGAAEIF